eukprot:TRINITY_DN2536_c0_g1_i1.p1 TRINITY_DN2536_c0_g1~~TRINITY_DN2536_c0_g1_i1.p1  ORF type:complete len:184 (+),score=22.31 TRINITY_DN2536_c0_g1_i1:101-652(+)
MGTVYFNYCTSQRMDLNIVFEKLKNRLEKKEQDEQLQDKFPWVFGVDIITYLILCLFLWEPFWWAYQILNISLALAARWEYMTNEGQGFVRCYIIWRSLFWGVANLIYFSALFSYWWPPTNPLLLIPGIMTVRMLYMSIILWRTITPKPSDEDQLVGVPANMTQDNPIIPIYLIPINGDVIQA